MSFDVSAAPRREKVSTEFEQNKKKLLGFLVQKQRAQALQLVNEVLQKTNDLAMEEKYLQLKETILTTFLSSEAQDHYEISGAQLFQNTKKAEKNIQSCLSLEPDNVLCLWQQLKVFKKKGDFDFKNAKEAFLILTESLPGFQMHALSLRKDSPDFTKSIINMNLTTMGALPSILEFERSIAAQNYSRAKELLGLIESAAPDYPDVLQMQAQLAEKSNASDWPEKKPLLKIYRKKCNSLSSELTRKYLYDIDLCIRG